MYGHRWWAGIVPRPANWPPMAGALVGSGPCQLSRVTWPAVPTWRRRRCLPSAGPLALTVAAWRSAARSRLRPAGCRPLVCGAVGCWNRSLGCRRPFGLVLQWCWALGPQIPLGPPVEFQVRCTTAGSEPLESRRVCVGFPRPHSHRCCLPPATQLEAGLGRQRRRGQGAWRPPPHGRPARVRGRRRYHSCCPR